MATTLTSFDALLRKLYAPYFFDRLAEQHVSEAEWKRLPKKGRPTLEEYRDVRRIMQQ